MSYKNKGIIFVNFDINLKEFLKRIKLFQLLRVDTRDEHRELRKSIPRTKTHKIIIIMYTKTNV